MKRRSFADRVEISVLGVGCGRIGSLSNAVPMREIEATLAAAIDAGVNLFDSADIYGQGDSERTLGRLLTRHQGRLFVVTKIGCTHGRYGRAVRFAKPILRHLVRSRPQARSSVVQARSRVMAQDFSVAHLRRAADASRRRLGVEQLDGLLLHNPTVEILRDAEVGAFLADLVRDGTASHVGASVESLEEVEAALAIPAIEMLQVPVWVAAAFAETDVPQRLRQRNVALFVREILRGPAPGQHGPQAIRAALAEAIAPDFVTAAIVGVSTRDHLDGLLAALT